MIAEEALRPHARRIEEVTEMMTRAQAVLPILVASSFAMDVPRVEADQVQESSLDAILLSSDAIIFATVAAVGPSATDEALAEVELDSLAVVGSRWPSLAEQGRIRINVRRRQLTADSVRPLRHDPALESGRRYLLFLRGGDWSAAPLITNGDPIYPVDEGIVRCAGGEVYGLGGNSLMCSTSERQFGPPMTEADLAAQLASALERARTRRPEVARAEDGAERALQSRPRSL